MFESTPMYPDVGRYWDMVQRHKLTQFYTAPTAIRSLMRFGDDEPNRWVSQTNRDVSPLSHTFSKKNITHTHTHTGTTSPPSAFSAPWVSP